MAEASSTGRAVALALLTLASVAAGFLSASVETDEPLVAAATLNGDQQAFAVNLTEGERAQIAMADDAGEATAAIYDPDDRLVEHVELRSGDPAEIQADTGGDWIVMQTGGDGGDLTIATSREGSAPLADRVEPLEIQEARRTLATQDEGALSVQQALRIDRQPAVMFLAVDGEAEALSGTIRSQDGPVFELDVETLNGTRSLAEGPGTVELTPANLEPGRYQVQVEADRFDGTVELVHRSYLRPGAASLPTNATPAGLADHGIPVAAGTEGQAFEVDPQGSDRIVIAAARDTTARVRVYDGYDDVTAIARVGPGGGYQWDFGEDADEATVERSTVPVRVSERYVVYISALGGHGDRVYLMLPGLRSAQPAPQLELVDREVHLGAGTLATSEEHQVEARLSGGLVAIDLTIEDTASSEHRIRVTGPQGLIFVHEQGTSAAGVTQETRHNQDPSHFSDGRFVVRVDEEYTVEGDAWVTLKHYKRPS